MRERPRANAPRITNGNRPGQEREKRKKRSFGAGQPTTRGQGVSATVIECEPFVTATRDVADTIGPKSDQYLANATSTDKLQMVNSGVSTPSRSTEDRMNVTRSAKTEHRRRQPELMRRYASRRPIRARSVPGCQNHDNPPRAFQGCGVLHDVRFVQPGNYTVDSVGSLLNTAAADGRRRASLISPTAELPSSAKLLPRGG